MSEVETQALAKIIIRGGKKSVIAVYFFRYALISDPDTEST